MTMNFSQHDSIAPDGAFDRSGLDSYSQEVAAKTTAERFYLFREKLETPHLGNILERPRIDDILQRSAGQFPATLVSGRAGTGKTALAVAFASEFEHVSWYSVESTDIEWNVFSQYFSAGLNEAIYGPPCQATETDSTQPDIARFLINRFAHAYAGPKIRSSLIVIDDIHHIFDTDWFEGFFNLLLYSLPPDSHLLLLCRSKPPGPIWRLRSKQMLNVLDEKVIAFTADETEALFEKLGLSTSNAKEVHQLSFGCIAKVLQFAKERSTILPPALS